MRSASLSTPSTTRYVVCRSLLEEEGVGGSSVLNDIHPLICNNGRRLSNRNRTRPSCTRAYGTWPGRLWAGGKVWRTRTWASPSSVSPSHACAPPLLLQHIPWNPGLYTSIFPTNHHYNQAEASPTSSTACAWRSVLRPQKPRACGTPSCASTDATPRSVHRLIYLIDRCVKRT